jgi:hypothetical protein
VKWSEFKQGWPVLVVNRRRLWIAVDPFRLTVGLLYQSYSQILIVELPFMVICWIVIAERKK